MTRRARLVEAQGYRPCLPHEHEPIDLHVEGELRRRLCVLCGRHVPLDEPQDRDEPA